MAEIMKQADFTNYEDDHQVVRLSESYGRHALAELFATLRPGRVTITRVKNGLVEHWDMSANEIESLATALSQYQADFAAYRETEKAKAQAEAEAEQQMIASAQRLAAQHGMRVITDDGNWWVIYSGDRYLGSCETDELLERVQTEIDLAQGI